MKALRNNFAGEGNATRKISKAEGIRDYLCYKNERSTEFELYLAKGQKMSNIFEEEGDQMDEDTKIRFLF